MCYFNICFFISLWQQRQELNPDITIKNFKYIII